MKTAVVLMQYDYGVKERGHSFEYINIYLPLCDVLGKENIVLFDFYDEFRNSGKETMNKKLMEFVKAEKPELTLFCLFTDEITESSVDSIREQSKTVIYFFDDPWRHSYVKHWRKHFDYFTTSDYYMLKQYKSEGIDNVIFTPFGYNSKVYTRKELKFKYDVSFVGGFSPLRKWIIEVLTKEGINVKVFGRGWGSGIKWLEQSEMVDVFNQSRINLNLSNGTSKDMGMILMSLKSLKALKHNVLNKKIKEQVKGRHFEINGCGGFQLSYFIPGLNVFYEIDKEIAVYEDIYNLPYEIKFFLKNEDMRSDIANAGYLRSIKDHSSQTYLYNMVNKIMNKEMA